MATSDEVKMVLGHALQLGELSVWGHPIARKSSRLDSMAVVTVLTSHDV